MMRAPFDPPWKQNEKRTVVTEWDLVPESSERGTIVASPDGFFIADETALPLWQTPNGVFARGGTNPDKELLTVFTPPDFRVLAPGKALKRTPDGNYIAQRFLIDPGNDFLPYVVAGRYQEKVIQSRQGEVQFWTFHPMDGTSAQRPMSSPPACCTTRSRTPRPATRIWCAHSGRSSPASLWK